MRPVRFLSRPVAAVLSLIMLAGCAQQDFMQIGAATTLCCPGDYESYESYGVVNDNLPGFLADYVVAEFDAAFQEKGLVRNDRLNDIEVTLQYNHINLNPDQEEVDPFDEQIQPEERLRYVAQVQILMHESDTGEAVWSGQINRIHSVLPGSYMHEERARPAFREAFLEALQSYPPLTD
ncbi:MAG: hypothetical protein ACQETO_13495 [Pseudomonadota bacterium]